MIQGLRELKQRYSEAEFAAMVAFIGIQNILWPMWLKICSGQGHQLHVSKLSRSTGDPLIHQSPWFCLLNPVDPLTAWGLVHGSGLSDSSAVLPELLDSEVGMSLTTFHSSSAFIYAKTAATFTRWGVYNAVENSGPNLGAIKEAPAVFDASGAKTNVFQLYIPFLNCERLLGDLPLWYTSTESAKDELNNLSSRLSPQDGDDAVINLFYDYAGQLWKLLQAEGIVECAPFNKEESGWRLSFRRQKKAAVFHGVFILLGDHKKLWQEMQGS